MNKNAQYKAEAFTSAVGDGWHDNFEYEEASRQEKMIMADINNMVANIRNIVIVDEKDNKEEIDIGDYVCFLQLTSDEELEGQELQIMKLAAGVDIDIFAEIPEISIDSPAGNALYSCKIGESSSYSVRGIEFTIIPKYHTKNLDDAISFKDSFNETAKIRK